MSSDLEKQKKIIQIIRPCGYDVNDHLASQISEFASRGFEIKQKDFKVNPDWQYTSASSKDRARELQEALQHAPSDSIIMSARGGYGASDLLPLIDWKSLLESIENISIVGFSDVSAIHSAIYSLSDVKAKNIRLIHGSMPSTSLWDFDLDETKTLLNMLASENPGQVMLHCDFISESEKITSDIAGPIFGGCFSVLTNLIGTQYFPDLKGHILFLEDIGEHPARLLRYFNQWIQSGALKGVKGIILGYFKDMGEQLEDNADFFLKEFALRSPVPVWHSINFGHIKKNMPINIGSTVAYDPDDKAFKLSI